MIDVILVCRDCKKLCSALLLIIETNVEWIFVVYIAKLEASSLTISKIPRCVLVKRDRTLTWSVCNNYILNCKACVFVCEVVYEGKLELREKVCKLEVYLWHCAHNLWSFNVLLCVEKVASTVLVHKVNNAKTSCVDTRCINSNICVINRSNCVEVVVVISQPVLEVLVSPLVTIFCYALRIKHSTGWSIHNCPSVKCCD